MRSIQAEANGKAMNQSEGSLFLEAMLDDRRELLSDSERAAVLQLLAAAKPRSKRPWGAMSPSPHPRLKYRMKVLLSGHEQYFYFKDDGALMHADLPEEKARDLARIITGVAGRMPKEEVPPTNQ